MSRPACILPLLNLVLAWDDSNFFDWFASELNETENEPLRFDGKLPSYLAGGTFVQSGPARFSFGKMKFLHMLDGYSKTNTLKFSRSGGVTYTTKFLASQFYNNSIKAEGIARGMFVGGIEPNPHWGPTSVFGANDNNYIKARRIGGQNMILADVTVATGVEEDHVTYQTNIRPEMLAASVPGIPWGDSLQPLGDMCMLGTMAHGAEDRSTGVFTGATGCFGVRGNYHIVFNIEPSAPTVRKQLAKIPLPHGRQPSYMHAMAATPNYIVLIAEPMFMDLVAVLEGKPLGKGGLVTSDDTTIFHVVNRKTGEVRNIEVPGFIYGHVLNSYEEDGDIVIDLTWYGANNATTMGWLNRWFIEYMGNKAIRESWPRSQIVRYRLKSSGQVDKAVLFADENGENDFETPKINENLEGQKYCITYFIQFHTYEYDKDKQASKSGPFGAVGLAKRNSCTGERSGWYEPNTYPSEVQFVPNPSGSTEDDGVLLGSVFDGNTNTSFFQVLDAKTMTRIAKAPLPIKTPFLIHATWFPDEEAALEISV